MRKSLILGGVMGAALLLSGCTDDEISGLGEGITGGMLGAFAGATGSRGWYPNGEIPENSNQEQVNQAQNSQQFCGLPVQQAAAIYSDPDNRDMLYMQCANQQ